MAGKKFINAKLKGYNELQEILVEDGVFKAIAPHIDVDSDCEIEDLDMMSTNWWLTATCGWEESR